MRNSWRLWKKLLSSTCGNLSARLYMTVFIPFTGKDSTNPAQIYEYFWNNQKKSVTLPQNLRYTMTEFKDLVQLRRSHRKFTEQEVDADDLKLILRAALMAPTSKSQRAWQFVVVEDKLDLEKLADAKNMGSQFLKGAPIAIVVLGDPMQNDCWVEDGSIAAISMQYQAEELGLGTCWIQMRGRGLDDGTTADTVIRGILDIPENMNCLCILAVGHWADERKPQAEDRLKWENVHLNKF